jgi:hypothetical protein
MQQRRRRRRLRADISAVALPNAVVEDQLCTDEEGTTRGRSNDSFFQKMELNLTWDVKTDGRPLIRATVLLLLLSQEGRKFYSSRSGKVGVES